MMSIKQKLTGKPSIDRPWMQYYPQEMIENLTVPNSTIYEYLMYNCPGDDVVAIHYYGRDITWKQIKEETDKVARALKAAAFVALSTAFSAVSCACVASLVASEVVVSSFNAVEASVAAATVGIGIMLTLTVKTVNHARIFFIFLIVPPSHELMC